MDLFRPSDLPHGHLNEVITFNRNSFNSSLPDQILQSDFQDFVFLTNILYNETSDYFVDLWLLAESLEDEDLKYLKDVSRASSASRPVCCY